jgi:hypothetical protein
MFTAGATLPDVFSEKPKIAPLRPLPVLLLATYSIDGVGTGVGVAGAGGTAGALTLAFSQPVKIASATMESAARQSSCVVLMMNLLGGVSAARG